MALEKTCIAACLLAWAANGQTNAPAEAPASFPPVGEGDRIVFLGDSITAKGEEPDGYLSLLRDVIEVRFKTARVIGEGVGWDQVRSLRDRFDNSVPRHKPTVVVIEIGINDLCQPGADSEVTREIFRMGIEDLAWRIRRLGARPVLCSLTVVGEQWDGSGEFDELLEVYCDMLRDVARRKQCQLVELREPFLAYLKAHNPDGRYSGILTTDGAHLTAEGNRLMADCLLRAFGLAEPATPSPVGEAPATSRSLPGEPLS
jgi:lysophospholipase L1-like esterase